MAATNNKVNSSEILRGIIKEQHRTYEYLRKKLDYKKFLAYLLVFWPMI